MWSNPWISCPRKLWSLYFWKCSRPDQHNSEQGALGNPVWGRILDYMISRDSSPSSTLWFLDFKVLKSVMSLNFYWSFNALFQWIYSSYMYFSDSFCFVNGWLNAFILLSEQVLKWDLQYKCVSSIYWWWAINLLLLFKFPNSLRRAAMRATYC